MVLSGKMSQIYSNTETFTNIMVWAKTLGGRNRYAFVTLFFKKNTEK